MSKTLGEKAYAIGFDYEKNYGGCAQCVIAAVYEVLPELKCKEIFKSATGLAGGIGLSTLGNCAAMTGAVMVLSQIVGRELEEIEDPERKRFMAYRIAKKLVDRFISEYGTVTCNGIQKKLMGRSFNMYEEFDEFLAAGGHSIACPSVVGNAAQWAVELIKELENRGKDEVLEK